GFRHARCPFDRDAEAGPRLFAADSEAVTVVFVGNRAPPSLLGAPLHRSHGPSEGAPFFVVRHSRGCRIPWRRLADHLACLNRGMTFAGCAASPASCRKLSPKSFACSTKAAAWVCVYRIAISANFVTDCAPMISCAQSNEAFRFSWVISRSLRL